MTVSPELSRRVPQPVISRALQSGPGQYQHSDIVFFVVPGPNGFTAILPNEQLPTQYG